MPTESFEMTMSGTATRDRLAKPNQCFKYNFCLVSRIANEFACSSSFDKAKQGDNIDVETARKQQEEMVEAFRSIGLDVIELPSDEKHPDGLFVNDIAVVINGTGLICNPPSMAGKPSRQGEKAVVRQVLKKELGLKIVEVDTDASIVEGSDVLWTGREIYVGIGNRTNVLGAQAVAKAFPEYATSMVKVHPPAVHLKDVISMAGPEIMAVAKTEGAQKTFQELKDQGGIGYKTISVEEGEAANVVYCNGTLMHLSSDQIPHGVQTYQNLIDYPRVAINMSEPLKRGGRIGNCVLLVSRVKHPKKIPTTIP